MSNPRRRRTDNRYHPPSNRPYSLLLGLVALVVLGLFAIAAFGDKLPLPDPVTDGAKSVATQIAPEIFPPSPEQAAAEADFRCRVARVNDGDTLRCQDGTRVRLHAISARETDNSCSPGHPCANASAEDATRTLKRLVSGKVLDCMTTGESYNRVTAICWTPERVEVNCHMVESGTAKVWERFDREVRICRDKGRWGRGV